MNENELAELLKYSSPKELYIITWNNILILLYCPFKVLVLVNIGALKCDDIVLVDEVRITRELKTVFIIKDKAYYYFYFDFVIDY
jgi:hypothetical protein